MPIRFNCKECGERIEAPSSHYGRQAYCTACGKPLLVPVPVVHTCDKCAKTRVLDGRRDGQPCRCGGTLKATQVFIKRLPGEASRTYDVEELVRQIGKPGEDF